MPSNASPDVEAPGRRLKQRVVLALSVSSVLPLLVLFYVVHRFVLSEIQSLSDVNLFGLHGLIFFTLLAMVGGAWLIWDLGQTIGHMGELLSEQPSLGELGNRTDEVGTLMKSFTGMLSTIEQQAVEINTFANRLDAAYKELEVTNTRLKETSFRDEVTGLYNRRFFSLRIEEELSRFKRFNHPVSVVILDIDGFKSVNDEFGHHAGDAVLKQFAGILKREAREIDSVGRYGGEEFLVLLAGTVLDAAVTFAERVRKQVEAHTFVFDGGSLRRTASFGVSGWPHPRIGDCDQLVRAADDALYVAKETGRNRVIRFDSDEFNAHTSANDRPERDGTRPPGGGDPADGELQRAS